MKKKTAYKIASGLMLVLVVYTVAVITLYSMGTIKLVWDLSNIEEMIKIGLYGSVSALLLLSSFVLLVVGCCLKKEQLSDPSQELKDLRAKKEQILEEIKTYENDIKLPDKLNEEYTEIDFDVPSVKIDDQDLKDLFASLHCLRSDMFKSLKSMYLVLEDYKKKSSKSYLSSSFDKDKFYAIFNNLRQEYQEICEDLKNLHNRMKIVEQKIEVGISSLEKQGSKRDVIDRLKAYVNDELLKQCYGFCCEKVPNYLSKIDDFIDCASEIQEREKIPASNLSSTADVAAAKSTQQASSV